MYEIEGCYHISHCVTDLDAADTFYRNVLGAHLVEKNYVESAKRDASFWVVADYVWEVVSPASVPGAAEAPLGLSESLDGNEHDFVPQGHSGDGLTRQGGGHAGGHCRPV